MAPQGAICLLRAWGWEPERAGVTDVLVPARGRRGCVAAVALPSCASRLHPWVATTSKASASASAGADRPRACRCELQALEDRQG